MKWERYLVHRFAIEVDRAETSADESARFDRAAQRDDANIIAIVNLQVRRELRRNLGEQFRLQFGEMTQKARHPAGGVVLGQPISGENMGKPRVGGWREPIFISSEPINH